MAALQRQKLLTETRAPLWLLFKDANPEMGYEILRALHGAGHAVEQYVGGDSLENALAYANAAKIPLVICAGDMGRLTAVDPQTGERREVALEELLKEGAEPFCVT
jgi:histidyl-tRNA synthetase